MDESEAGVASSWRTEGGIAVASSEMMELGMLAKMFSKSLPLPLLLSLEVSSEPKSLVVSMSSKMSLSSR
jgi:hypothetical protein